MGAETLLALLGLALVDSTSFGTLVIPIILIVAARSVPLRPLGVYFATITIFYLVIGILLLFGFDALFDQVADLVDTTAGSWLQLAVGVVLVVVSFRIGNNKNPTAPRRSRIPAIQSNSAMIGLGFTAGVIEVASMVPYLSAIGLLSASDAAMGTRILVLAGYCLVMILPAAIVMLGSMVIGDRIWPKLERFSVWLQKQAEETVAWIIGIAGFLIAADAASRLELF
jgi:cytochrome c biogenesis protein CcdA